MVQHPWMSGPQVSQENVAINLIQDCRYPSRKDTAEIWIFRNWDSYGSR